MIRPIFLVAMLAVLLAVSLSCSSAPDAVRMGTEGAYPPFNFINDDGEVDGLERELGDELCRRGNLDWTFRISSGVSQGIDKSVVQSDWEFLRIGVGGRR